MADSSHVVLDLSDGALFGNDAGEDELPDILNSYFVDQGAFKPFLSKDNAFQVARSRKGMGKSALLNKLAYDLSIFGSDHIVINVTGANLIGILSPPRGASYLELQNYWTKVICARINFEIGKSVGFAFAETDMALVESAEIAGFKERNIVGSLIQRVKSSKIPIEITVKDYNNHEELLKRALEKYNQKKVWLLVDDIDSTYVDTPDQQAITSTFFSACRALVREVDGLFIRASVRSDVWKSLRNNEDLDKCEQYITDIYWSVSNLKTLLSKKIYAYFKRNSLSFNGGAEIDYRVDADYILSRVFTPKMTWGGRAVPPFRPINILAAGRPRWMAQLCRLAGVEAVKRDKERIGVGDINLVMPRFSQLRLDDIYKEHGHQYGELKKLIETFSNSPARYNTNDLLSQISVKYVNHIGAANVHKVDGLEYKYPMQIAHFLYRIGFIVGRKEHYEDAEHAEFVKFEERSDLLTDVRNPDDGLLWEVHPSYRSALNIGKEQRSAEGAERSRSAKRQKANRRVSSHKLMPHPPARRR